MSRNSKKVICYLSAAAGDWGGASRVLFTNLRLIDRSRYEPLVLLPGDGPIIPLLNELGIRHAIWGKHHEPAGWLRYIGDVIRAARFFRRNGVDLLHINHANYWRPAEIVAARLLGIPVVTHYHVVVKQPGPYVRWSSLIAAVSAYTARHSEPQSVPHVVVHNSVAVERFDRARDLRAELGFAPEDVVVSFIGQIRKIKGMDLFIRMAHRIEGAHVKFMIAGECRDPARFEGAYTQAQLEAEIAGDSRIRYVGYRTDAENLFRTSDIVVMPSRWGEPFGLINIEAGAARKPIVSARDGGIPEVIRDGENGFLVEPEDLDGLVDRTQRLVDDHSLRVRMGERGREIVEAEFTDRPMRRLEQAYAELLAGL